MEEKALKSYEIGYLARGEEGTGAIISHLKRLGAVISFEGEVKSIKLTYPVEHLPSAYFGYVHFKIQPELIGSLNDALKLDSQITRFLVITPPFAKERGQKPSFESAQMRRIAKPKVEGGEGVAVSNDLLEEKLEEILK